MDLNVNKEQPRKEIGEERKIKGARRVWEKMTALKEEGGQKKERGCEYLINPLENHLTM